MSDVGLAKTLRAPVQGRSKASYERMLSAAEELNSSPMNTKRNLVQNFRR